MVDAAWTPEEGAQRARRLYAERFGGEPAVVAAAPGRVNLIGEHTDYNGGLCLPIALPYATYAAGSPRTDGRFRLVSGESDDAWEGGAGDLSSAPGWAAYAAGVVWALAEAGHRTEGLDLAVTGCVPLGAGLSSSAALECATGTTVLALLGSDADPTLLAEAGVRAENEVAGAATGGMDQAIAVHGRAGRALLLDCRSWESTQVPFAPEDDGLALLVVDTQVHHTLNDGGYGSRRADCDRAAEALGVASLREAGTADLDRLDDERIRRRARHVVTEIARVEAFAAALRERDWTRVGRLMLDSHASMRDDFEISVPELDAVVEVARDHGALGARMTGGGFGGSAIALVPAAAADDVRRAVDARFAGAGWTAPRHLDGVASAGSRVLSRPRPEGAGRTP